MGIPSLPFTEPGLEISVGYQGLRSIIWQPQKGLEGSLTSVLTQEKLPWDRLGFPPRACWDIPMSIESHSEVTL